MHGLVLAGVRRIEHRTDLPDPTIVEASDAIVAVSRAGLCGSDLHPFEGREAVRFGVVAGHEAVGEVVAVGAEVRRARAGERVLVPFTTSCEACPECRRSLSARCRRGSLFGYGPADEPEVPALGGGQAELVRVPLADGTLVPAPDGLTDVEALLLTDNLPTGWYAAERAAITPGDPVAIVGLGAVGLCAVVAAGHMGAGTILAVDPVDGRRARAARLGATTAHPDAACAAAHDLLAGGAAAVIESAGTPAAQRLASRLARPGATLSMIAVQTGERFGFTPVDAYDANLTVRVGRAPVRSLLDRLLPLATSGRLAVPSAAVVTHPAVPLADGPGTYARFAAREPGMVKAVFAPSR